MPQWWEDVKQHKAAWIGLGIGGGTLLVAILAYRHNQSVNGSASPMALPGGSGMPAPQPTDQSGYGDILSAINNQDQSLLNSLSGIQNSLDTMNAAGSGAGTGSAGAPNPWSQTLTVRAPGTLAGAEAYDAANAGRGLPVWSRDRTRIIGYATYGQGLTWNGSGPQQLGGGPGTEFGSSFYSVLLGGVQGLINAVDVLAPPQDGRSWLERGARRLRGQQASQPASNILPFPAPAPSRSTVGAQTPARAISGGTSLEHVARRIE